MNRTIFLYLIFWAFSLTSLSGFAQECIHTNLSRNIDFKINIVRNSDTSDFIHGAKIDLLIYNKHKVLLQKISFKCEFLLDDAYTNCDNPRSYITGHNKNKEAPDNDYSDLIIADLNFDGKEDFAIKYDSGGNAGPLYAFYIQQDNMHFKKGTFLSEKMMFFPLFMDSKSRTLITHSHADAYGYYESTFAYNMKTRKWRRVEHAYRKA